MAQLLGIIQESHKDQLQDLISQIHSTNRLVQQKGNVLKKRRDTLLTILKDIRETDTKLADSKVSCSTALYSSMNDDSDLIQKLYDEISHKDQQIQELKDQVDTLTSKLRNSQACNEEMQYQLQQKQQQQYQRVNKPSQSIINILYTQRLFPPFNLDVFNQQVIIILVQTLSTNSSISIENPKSKEDMQKMIRRISMQAAASAHILAVKGDYTSLQVAHEEMLSQKSLGSQKSLSFK
ncbi:unnamed protein product (macronuclear) [Paramecium tetraurelia]|uniref:Uncharacterized protein n=1 Tax=Paramecium tetraurelia TaxID=5888 RepID=A0BPM6_PARTE|nr:uncharacterized protein GSPATT00005242001 [Paramecium tetraurelia]CAK60493.1 unnamed protein product [Paramecium tetraurelia]|eukprot:XP_001427891.1 hypothetical protein (macronuclear) [Paramecium tetraurelia strain d4-2]